MFTLINAAILSVFAVLIFYSASENREKEFYALLRKEALTKANLFFNAKVDTKALQDIYSNNRKILNEVEVAIYDTDFNLLYHDASDIDFVKESKKMIDDIGQNGEKQFYQEGWQVIGMSYTFEGKNFVITAAAYDEYGFVKLNNLLKNSILVFVFSIVFIYLAGLFFSKKALSAVTEMTEKARQISANNLHLRIVTNEKRDELSDLANTFNEMLNRLESSFEAQKQFVSNISHELRTPLAAMIAETELALSREKSIPEYQKTLQNLLFDAKKLARLSDGLLDLAKANYDPSEISFKNIRADEILLDAMQELQKINKEFKIELHYEGNFEDEKNIVLRGNEYLLKVAFVNLAENACKFSDNQKCTVSINCEERKIILSFTDTGIGIDENDIDKVFVPFYRGANKNFAAGNGIGLPLAQKIILLHKGSIRVDSKKNKGTTFWVELPAGVETVLNHEN